NEPAQFVRVRSQTVHGENSPFIATISFMWSEDQSTGRVIAGDRSVTCSSVLASAANRQKSRQKTIPTACMSCEFWWTVCGRGGPDGLRLGLDLVDGLWTGRP